MQTDLFFDNLTFTYPGSSNIPALDGASACLPGGSAVALVGPNGAGKSTLCKVLNGVLKAGSGTIRFADERISPYLQPGKYVAYSFQNPDDQLFLPTVRKELSFGPRNVGMKGTQLEQAVSQALKLFDLVSAVESHPLDLPFVLRKRVAMAAAVAMQRPWVVLDEPTLGQDPQYCREIITIKNHLLERGTSVIMISHDVEFTFEACDRFLIMSAGKCVWSDTREEFLNHRPSAAGGFVNLEGRLTTDLHLPVVCLKRIELVDYITKNAIKAEDNKKTFRG